MGLRLVQYLVGELRFHTRCSAAKNFKKKKKNGREAGEENQRKTGDEDAIWEARGGGWGCLKTRGGHEPGNRQPLGAGSVKMKVLVMSHGLQPAGLLCP